MNFLACTLRSWIVLVVNHFKLGEVLFLVWTIPRFHLFLISPTVLPHKKEKKRKEKTTQAVKTLPTSIKEKGIPRAEAPCIPFTKRNKRNNSMGITRVTSSSPCLILVTRVEKSLLKSASGAIMLTAYWTE
eukprot:1141540-Pelagomonas_calceolata.AAC.1